MMSAFPQLSGGSSLSAGISGLPQVGKRPTTAPRARSPVVVSDKPDANEWYLKMQAMKKAARQLLAKSAECRANTRRVCAEVDVDRNAVARALGFAPDPVEKSPRRSKSASSRTRSSGGRSGLTSRQYDQNPATAPDIDNLTMDDLDSLFPVSPRRGMSARAQRQKQVDPLVQPPAPKPPPQPPQPEQLSPLSAANNVYSTLSPKRVAKSARRRSSGTGVPMLESTIMAPSPPRAREREQRPSTSSVVTGRSRSRRTSNGKPRRATSSSSSASSSSTSAAPSAPKQGSMQHREAEKKRLAKERYMQIKEEEIAAKKRKQDAFRAAKAKKEAESAQEVADWEAGAPARATAAAEKEAAAPAVQLPNPLDESRKRDKAKRDRLAARRKATLEARDKADDARRNAGAIAAAKKEVDEAEMRAKLEEMAAKMLAETAANAKQKVQGDDKVLSAEASVQFDEDRKRRTQSAKSTAAARTSPMPPPTYTATAAAAAALAAPTDEAVEEVNEEAVEEEWQEVEDFFG